MLDTQLAVSDCDLGKAQLVLTREVCLLRIHDYGQLTVQFTAHILKQIQVCCDTTLLSCQILDCLSGALFLNQGRKSSHRHFVLVKSNEIALLEENLVFL